MIESLIISLVLTIILESFLAILVNIKDRESLSTLIWINCLTNPIVVYLTNMSRLIINNTYITNLILIFLEIIVVFVEGYLFKKNLKNLKINSYIFSIYLNGLSFLIGVLLSYILNI